MWICVCARWKIGCRKEWGDLFAPDAWSSLLSACITDRTYPVWYISGLYWPDFKRCCGDKEKVEIILCFSPSYGMDHIDLDRWLANKVLGVPAKLESRRAPLYLSSNITCVPLETAKLLHTSVLSWSKLGCVCELFTRCGTLRNGLFTPSNLLSLYQ